MTLQRGQVNLLRTSKEGEEDKFNCKWIVLERLCEDLNKGMRGEELIERKDESASHQITQLRICSIYLHPRADLACQQLCTNST